MRSEKIILHTNKKTTHIAHKEQNFHESVST